MSKLLTNNFKYLQGLNFESIFDIFFESSPLADCQACGIEVVIKILNF